MSEFIVDTKGRSEEGVGEEDIDIALSLPDRVYNANWRDDVPEEAGEENEATSSYEFFDEESSYESPQGDVGADLEKRLKLFGRDENRRFGHKISELPEFVGKAA